MKKFAKIATCLVLICCFALSFAACSAKAVTVTINDSGTEYYQVALTVRDENTLKRELTPLDSISDHNPKYLLTLDDDPPTSHNGIKQLNALEWLLNK